MAKTRFILLPLLAVLLFQFSLACSNSSLTENPTIQPKAALVDQLSLTAPNQTFVEEATSILNQSGYSVDYCPGEKATVDFYRTLMASGYNIIILRVHSGIAAAYNELAFFTSEPYSQPMNSQDPKYGDMLYDRIGEVTYHDPPAPGETAYFAVRYQFVKEYGRFNGTTVIVMGCYGMKYPSMAQAFTEKGAQVYIGWDGLESADHSDEAAITLLKHLILEKQTIGQAVENTMTTIGVDPSYNSTLLFYPSTSANQTIQVFPISVAIPTTISISTSSPTSRIGFTVNITGDLDDIHGEGLKGETVVLRYTFPGVDTWTPITSATTDNLGHYQVVWIPPATGYFTIRAEWAGNTTHLSTNSNATLASLVYESQYIFTVESNSTINELAFDTANHQLSFNATGPEGTKGYAKVRMAKSFTADSKNIKVYFDNSQRDYTIASTDDSWLMTFDYTHSTHKVTISLGTVSTSFIDTLEGKVAIFGTVAAAIAVLVAVFIMRRRHTR